MTLPTLRLSATGLDDLELDPFAGWIVQSFDPGAPVVREVVQGRSGANGTNDGSSLTGARVCTLSVVLAPDDSDDVGPMEDLLRAYTLPSRRPTIHWTRPGQAERVATGRGFPIVAPIEVVDEVPIVAQWAIPSGRFLSTTLHSATITPGTAEAGLEIPQAGLVIPQAGLVIPSAGSPGFGIIHNAGIADSPAILRVFGPFGDTGGDETVITNQTTGDQLVFVDLEVLAGEYLEIDLDTKRITLNGDSAQSRRRFLDNSQSDWFLLEPGDNQLAFLPDTYTAPAQMQVFWRDAY